MIENEQQFYPVIFNAKGYYGIKYFDCFKIELFTDPTLESTLFTTFPISLLQYRREHGTKAKVNLRFKPGYTVFNITDDYECLHVVEISNILLPSIKIAREFAKEQQLLQNTYYSEKEVKNCFPSERDLSKIIKSEKYGSTLWKLGYDTAVKRIKAYQEKYFKTNLD